MKFLAKKDLEKTESCQEYEKRVLKSNVARGAANGILELLKTSDEYREFKWTFDADRVATDFKAAVDMAVMGEKDGKMLEPEESQKIISEAIKKAVQEVKGADIKKLNAAIEKGKAMVRETIKDQSLAKEVEPLVLEDLYALKTSLLCSGCAKEIVLSFLGLDIPA
jgi:hypothetical protein